MKINLRHYQKQVIADIYSQIRAGEKRILTFAPTGAGKTIISAQIIQHITQKQKKVLFLVHRDILVAQTYEKLQKFGLTCGFIKSGWEENRDELIQIASVQTLGFREWWHTLKTDVVMLDEAHITGFSTIVKRMMSEIFPDSIYIGLTATPFRLSKKEGIGDVFEALVCAPMPNDLINQGYLVKPSYHGVTEADLKNVPTKNGEFDKAKLAIACNQPELIEQIVQEYIRLAKGRRAIAFAVDVAHSKNIAAAFNGVGIKAGHVDGTTPIKERNRIYAQLAKGEIMVLSSCMALTEGFDVPSVNAVLLCRPTQSLALYLQMIGRGLRLSPETEKIDCLVIDQSGNVGRHGFVEDLKNVSLEEGEDGNSSGMAPTKTCPLEEGGCGKIIYAFYQKCPSCQHNFEIKKITVALGLKRLIREEDIERIQYYRQLLKTAFDRAYSPGWAAEKFQEVYFYYPPYDWGRNAIFGDRPKKSDKNKYLKHLEMIQERLKKKETWITRYFEQEFGH